MGFPWRKLWIGTKVALGIAIKLQEAKIIRVKELEAGKGVVEVIDGAIADAKKTP